MAQPSAVSVDELERLVDTLQDDAARAKLVAQLRTLIAAQRGTAVEKTAVGPALFAQLTERIDALTGEILAGVAGVIVAPRLVGWVRHQISDPAARRLWSEAALAFASEHEAELGAAARAYVEREHALPRVADAYVTALELAAGGDAVDDAVLRRIAEAAADVGQSDPVSLARAAIDAGIVG